MTVEARIVLTRPADAGLCRENELRPRLVARRVSEDLRSFLAHASGYQSIRRFSKPHGFVPAALARVILRGHRNATTFRDDLKMVLQMPGGNPGQSPHVEANSVGFTPAIPRLGNQSPQQQ